MAETVAAFSLAVNILQVVDLGASFVKLAWQIWRSSKVDSLEINTLRHIAKNSKTALEQLQIATPPRSHPVEDEANRRIFELATRCGEVSQRVIDTIDNIGVVDEAHKIRRSKRKAIVTAFKITWESEAIKALETQLKEYKSEIMLELAISLRHCMTKSLQNQDLILQKLIDSQDDNHKLSTKLNNISEEQEGLGSILITYLIKRADTSNSAQLGTILSDLSDGLPRAVYDPRVPPVKEDSVFEIPDSRRSALEKKFISKLRYDGMHDRGLWVTEAHQETFRWIFETDGQERPWTNFCEWLASDQTIYWITGKAGSGKSTLMKFISEPVIHCPQDYLDSGESRCRRHLLRWANGKPLIIASFYFWEAGSKIQKSKEGLYRSLLCQILQASPEAISHASLERWETLCLYNSDPRPLTEIELSDMLTRAIAFLSSTAKLCLFIDGLDEFSGEHDDLIKLVMQITDKYSVKICISSRPWLVFEDALKSKPNLMLEDLTYNDIMKYITSMFNSDPEFALLQKREATFAQGLANDIAHKSAGVFLWVTLVVSSLLSGMSHGDRVSDLRRRLDQLPSDLEMLYEKILSSLDKFYLEHAAQFFYFMRACSEPPEALLLSFADEEDPDFALKLPKWPLSFEEMGDRVETIRRRMNSCCKGLIGVPKSAMLRENYSIEEITVQYLHKSVKDYIEQPNVLERISNMVGKPFDPHLSLCSGALAMFKTHREGIDDRSTFSYLGQTKIRKCIRFASKVSQVNASAMIKILDELKRTTSWGDPSSLYTSFPQKFEGPSFDGSSHARRDLKDWEFFGDCFLSMAVKYNVVEYVRRKIEPDCVVRPGKTPLGLVSLPKPSPKRPAWNPFKHFEGSHSADSHTTWPLLLDATPSAITSLEMVTVLLEHGANPNFTINCRGRKSSIWIETLGIALANIKCYSTLWDKLLPLMVIHGANISLSVLKQAFRVAAYHQTKWREMTAAARSLRRELKSAKSGKPDFRFRLADVSKKWERVRSSFSQLTR